MNKPIIHDYLTQIFARHYGLEATPAAEAALKFIDILDGYEMQLILGEWTVPEPLQAVTGWDRLLLSNLDVLASGREPWLASEIQ